MTFNDKIDHIWKNLLSQSFTGIAYSYGDKGISINFEPTSIMNIYGGSFQLPQHMYLQISDTNNNYIFYNDKLNYDKMSSDEKSLHKIHEFKNTMLDTDLQIFRLLDPRVLLKPKNYELLSFDEKRKNKYVHIKYFISTIFKNNPLHLSFDFLNWLKNNNKIEQTAHITLNEYDQPIRILQKDITSNDDVSLRLHYPINNKSKTIKI